MIKKPKKKNKDTQMTKKNKKDILIEKTIDIYDFSEEGFRAWHKALSKEAKIAIGNDPIIIPPDFIIESIRTKPSIGLETIFIPDYEDLIKYGRAVRLRLISLAIMEKHACSRLTFLINTLKEYQNTNKDMYKKVSLIAEDMREASKNILGKRVTKSIYRKNSINMITSTMGTIIKVKPSHSPEVDSQEKIEPKQESSIPTVE